MIHLGSESGVRLLELLGFELETWFDVLVNVQLWLDGSIQQLFLLVVPCQAIPRQVELLLKKQYPRVVLLHILVDTLQLLNGRGVILCDHLDQLLGLQGYLPTDQLLIVLRVAHHIIIPLDLLVFRPHQLRQPRQLYLHRHHTIILILEHLVHRVRIQVRCLLPFQQGVLLQVPIVDLLLHLPVLLLEVPHLRLDVVILLLQLVDHALQHVVLLPEDVLKVLAVHIMPCHEHVAVIVDLLLEVLSALVLALLELADGFLVVQLVAEEVDGGTLLVVEVDGALEVAAEGADGLVGLVLVEVALPEVLEVALVVGDRSFGHRILLWGRWYSISYFDWQGLFKGGLFSYQVDRILGRVDQQVGKRENQ